MDRGPRVKMRSAGPASLTDAELLSVFLRGSRSGTSALQLAAELLDYFGGLRGLMQAEQADLLKCPGIGTVLCAEVACALEISRRYLQAGLERGATISDPLACREFLQIRLKREKREVFACLFLDSQHRLIQYEELFYGTIDSASVHPREVVRRALELCAAAVILAHNHPSGVAEPSQADRRITARLQSALALVDIGVLDHLVVGDTEMTSFAERGLL